MKTRGANLRTRIRNYRLAIVRDRRGNTRKVVGVRDLDYWPKLICSGVRAEQKRNEMSTIVISEDRDLRDSVAAARRRYRLPRCLHRSVRRLVSSRETGNPGRRHVLLSPGMQKRRLLPSLPRSLASHGARRRPKTATANTDPRAPNRSPPGTARPTQSPRK
jgi:hypothetical protein